MMDGLFELRDSLQEMVKCCADNVEIVIYVNHILDQAIVFKRGKCENRIRITIKSNGKMTHNWTKETRSKKLWDCFHGFLGLVDKYGVKILEAFISSKTSIGLKVAGKVANGVIEAICEK